MGRSQCGGIVNQFSRIREIAPSCLGKALIWGAIVSNVCSLRYPYSDNRAGSGYFRSTSGEPGFPMLVPSASASVSRIPEKLQDNCEKTFINQLVYILDLHSLDNHNAT